MPSSIELERSARAVARVFVRQVGVSDLAVTFTRLLDIRSEPLDGVWITAMAEARLGDTSSVGYATAPGASSDLRWRAVGEAVERVVWSSGAAEQPGTAETAPDLVSAVQQQPGVRWPGRTAPEPVDVDDSVIGHLDHQSGVERTSIGSAVHQSAAAAILAGAREVTERICFLRGFHGRSLGLPIALPPALRNPRGVRLQAWHEQRSDLVTVAALAASGAPRLAMAASVAGGDPARAVEHCVGELVQARPWIRQRQRTGPPVVGPHGISDPGTRADYWSTCDPTEASLVFDELLDGSGEATWSVPDPGDILLVALARVAVNGSAPIWYARMVAPAHAYRLHSFALEQKLFGHISGGRLRPHPLI